MHAAKADGTNVSIMTPSEDKDDKGVQQSVEDISIEADPKAKEDTIKLEPAEAAEEPAEVQAAVQLPPDLKEAKNSPSCIGSAPQEVAELLFSASPPTNTAKEEKTPDITEKSKEEIEESKSTPNTPLRGSSGKDVTPVKKKMRSWLSLSPSRRRMKEQARDEADGIIENNEVGNLQVEKDDANEVVEIRETKGTTMNTPNKKEVNTPKQAEPVTEVVGTTTKVKQEDFELVTVGEGVEGVQQAERRNYARATSNDDLSDDAQEEPKTTEIAESKSKADEERAKEVNESEEHLVAAAEETGKCKVPTTSELKKKKKWFKAPKINLSFNKKRAKKKMESEGLLSGEPKEMKEPEEKKEPKELDFASKSVVSAAEMDVDSSREISYQTKPITEPKGAATPEINNFLRLSVMVAILVILVTSFVDPEFACTPSPHGIVLDKITLKQYTSEAPWWVPTSLKSKGLFQRVCGDRPRTKLEWTFQKQSKDTKFHQLVISDQDCSDPKKAALLNRKNIVSATVGLHEITVVNKKGNEEVLSAPWRTLEP